MIIRKAVQSDLAAVAKIYDNIHAQEDAGKVTIGWVTGVYPVEATAKAALQRGDLFVCEDDSKIVATAIINRTQVDSYAGGHWQYPAPDDEVMVLHTLVVDPLASGKGIGKAFVAYYEQYAAQNGCHYLRMDTNVKNANARAMYAKLGFSEPDIVSCDFNGIAGIKLVLLEKKLDF